MYTFFVFQVWCTISNIHFGHNPIHRARVMTVAATRVQWHHCVRSDFAQRKKGTARFEQFRMKSGLSFYELEAFCHQSPTKLSQVSLTWHFYVQSPGKHGPSVERLVHLKTCTGHSPLSLACKAVHVKKDKLSSTWARAHFMTHAVQIYRRQGLNESCRLLSKGLEERVPPNLHSTW